MPRLCPWSGRCRRTGGKLTAFLKNVYGTVFSKRRAGSRSGKQPQPRSGASGKAVALAVGGVLRGELESCELAGVKVSCLGKLAKGGRGVCEGQRPFLCPSGVGLGVCVGFFAGALRLPLDAAKCFTKQQFSCSSRVSLLRQTGQEAGAHLVPPPMPPALLLLRQVCQVCPWGVPLLGRHAAAWVVVVASCSDGAQVDSTSRDTSRCTLPPPNPHVAPAMRMWNALGAGGAEVGPSPRAGGLPPLGGQLQQSPWAPLQGPPSSGSPNQTVSFSLTPSVPGGWVHSSLCEGHGLWEGGGGAGTGSQCPTPLRLVSSLRVEISTLLKGNKRKRCPGVRECIRMLSVHLRQCWSSFSLL